ncbi:MAG: undecaprenyl-phosphate glucose phosphotransferase [Ignavibacteria bacterium]|nr:undecaprenyl-phosphate glucose phosphotransferase [Ignavibacteria bacterium]
MEQKSTKVEIILPVLTIFFDVIAILIAYYISYQIRFFTTFNKIFPITEGIPELGSYLLFAVITIPLWIAVFQQNKLYKLNRNVFIFDEFFQIFKCVTISIIFSIGIIFFFVRSFSFSRLVFVLIWLDSTLLILFFRYFTLKLEKTFYNKRIGLKNVAVVGSNDIAAKILNRFRENVYVGFNVIGYFAKQQNNEFSNNIKYLGDYKKIPEMIKKYGVQKILISVGLEDQNDVFILMKLCQGINVEFMLYPDYMEVLTSKVKIEHIDGIPFMKLKSIPMNTWNKILKRLFDIIFSFLFILFLSPFLLLIALLVKITSKGPVFYSQERVGLDQKKFNIIKFRSMIQNAETEGPVFASKDEKRYTKIGKILRKYSLDELPQFFNVLKGDMSIVGPRPEREYFINQLKETVVNYLERHRVKSGITGWAQVNGYRGSTTSIQTRIDYDIYYIENWSLAFDMKIIFRTLKETFFSRTAI